MLYWFIVSGLAISVFAAFVKICSMVGDHYHKLLWKIEATDRKMNEWKSRYVHPANEFHYHWTRAAGQDDDFDILRWCMDKACDAIRYKYHNDTGPGRTTYPACLLEVWITDPKLAMEFKLRFHGI